MRRCANALSGSSGRRNSTRQRYRSLKALVKDSRKLWSDALLSVDHGDLLYDELGLPK